MNIYKFITAATDGLAAPDAISSAPDAVSDTFLLLCGGVAWRLLSL